MLPLNQTFVGTWNKDLVLPSVKVVDYVQGKDVTMLIKEKVRGTTIETSLHFEWREGLANTLYHN